MRREILRSIRRCRRSQPDPGPHVPQAVESAKFFDCRCNDVTREAPSRRPPARAGARRLPYEFRSRAGFVLINHRDRASE